MPQRHKDTKFHEENLGWILSFVNNSSISDLVARKRPSYLRLAPMQFIPVLVLLLTTFLGTRAQDTIQPNFPDTTKVYYFYNNFETQGTQFLTEIDTLITNVENYDPPTLPGYYYATLGNPGLAHVNMVYNPVINSGFNFGIHSFDQYLYHNDSIQHYWVGKPFTHLFFIQGAKKEQNLHVDHSQNMASWITAGINFRYVNSPGYYTNQLSDDKNFVFKSRFHSKDFRYMVLAHYIHNKLKIEENGGIIYDTVFEENISTDRRGFLVNLNEATNYYRENSYYIKQFFKLSKRKRFDPNDTTQYKSLFNRLNPGNISHSILLSDKTWKYEQPLTDQKGYYQFTHDSVNPTFDSTFTYSMENQIAWTNGDNAKDQLLTFNFMLRHLYAEHSVDSIESKYNQLIPTGEVSFKVSDVLKLDFFGDFVTGNSNVGDFNLIGKLKLNTKFGTLQYELQNANQEVDQFYSFYRSNHFRWENNFKKQYFLINKASISYKSFRADLNVYAVENFVYLDSIGFPAQLSKNLQVLQLQAKKLFKAGNWSFDTRVIYQTASNPEGIRIPELIGSASIYFTKDLFKQATIMQTGIDVFYNTSYYSYAYMPATRGFYIQNEKELGDYAYANFFLTLQIKRARLFLKWHNLGFFMNDFSYYTVPSYPMKDGGVRFGVSWMFYD